MLVNQGPAAGIRNGADVLLRSLVGGLFGERGLVLFGAAVAVAMAAWAVRDRRRAGQPLRAGVFLAMTAESVVLALAFGIVVGLATASVLDALPLAVWLSQEMSWPLQLTVSLGAGFYEELLFRVLLVSGLLLLARRVLGWGSFAATSFAVTAGALVFSAFHYIGPYGDPLELPSFLFRSIAGLAFSGLYVARGFGITAWTHALYDVFLLAARG